MAVSVPFLPIRDASTGKLFFIRPQLELGGYELTVTDLLHVWSETADRAHLDRVQEELMPRLDFTSEGRLTHMRMCVLSPATRWIVTRDVETDRLTLAAESTDIAHCAFAWQFVCAAHPRARELVRDALLLPFMEMALGAALAAEGSGSGHYRDDSGRGGGGTSVLERPINQLNALMRADGTLAATYLTAVRVLAAPEPSARESLQVAPRELTSERARSGSPVLFSQASVVRLTTPLAGGAGMRETADRANGELAPSSGPALVVGGLDGDAGLSFRRREVDSGSAATPSPARKRPREAIDQSDSVGTAHELVSSPAPEPEGHVDPLAMETERRARLERNRARALHGQAPGTKRPRLLDRF